MNEDGPVAESPLLQRIDELDEERSQKAVKVVWGSVALASVALAAIFIGGGYAVRNAREELKDVRKETETAQKDLKTATEAVGIRERRIGELDALIVEKTRQLAVAENRDQASSGVIDNLPAQQARNLIEEKIKRDPAVAPLLSRAYFLIQSENDREAATQVSHKLQDAGILVPRITPTDTRIESTQVRYYKATERKTADDIATLLANSGVSASVVPVPGGERNTRVRPYHYEVWFAPLAQ